LGGHHRNNHLDSSPFAEAIVGLVCVIVETLLLAFGSAP
jgi:hypothetical protein